MASHRSPWTAYWLVLGVYLLLALGLSWPLVAHITTYVPGIPQWAFDESTFLWNAWYFKHALVDNLANPLHSEMIYYPLGIDLILHTYNFYHALVVQPLMAAVNLPFASNVALLASTVLSGYGVYLLMRYLLARAAPDQTDRKTQQWAAFAAGLLYAFASNRAVYAALGHYDMATTQWIPFYALALVRSLDAGISARRRRQAAAWAGLFFAFNGLAEMITAMFLAIFTAIVVLVALVQRCPENLPESSGASWKAQSSSHLEFVPLPSLVLSLAITGAVAFLVWLPALAPILAQFFGEDYSLKGWGEAIPLSADLLGWFTPTVLHPIFGGDLVAELRRVQLRALEMGVRGFRDVNTVFLGWAGLALALAGAWTYRRTAIWRWTAVLFGLLTLGPFLQINGEYRFALDGVETSAPLPFALLHYIPVVKANRAPNRNSVLLMLGLAVLAGYGLYWLLRRLPEGSARTVLRPVVAVMACALILFEHLAVPLPLSDARVPAVYAQIAADPRPVSVMHLPLGWRNSFGVFGPEQTQLQYYQSVHGKPMLGGNVSRAPDFKMDYFRRLPFFQTLADIQFGRTVAPEMLDAAKAQAADLMYLYNTGYVILTPPIPQRFPYADHWQAAWAFIKEAVPLEPEPFWAQDGIEAYRVVQPDGEDHFNLELGTADSLPYRGEGWDLAPAAEDQPYNASATWATAQSSRLFVPLRDVDPLASYEISVRLHPFVYPGGPTQTVDLVVNGVNLGRQPLSDGWQAAIWQAPGHLLIDGLNRIELIWNYAVSPRAALGGHRNIGATGVELPIDADLKAFADGGYIALFDDEGNQIDASAGRRGVNVTVMDPATGAVVDRRGFDTTANAFESEALADYLAQVAPGQIVLVASYGDAAAHLGEAAVDGLRGIGAGVSLDALRGNYFAMIGVQGAAPESAAVVIDPNQAFLSLSYNRDYRPLAASVDWLNISR
jgi:hypothetical protein